MKAFVVNGKTGEVIYEFTKMDMFLGKQYMEAWCVGHYYYIDRIKTEADTTIYYVH